MWPVYAFTIQALELNISCIKHTAPGAPSKKKSSTLHSAVSSHGMSHSYIKEIWKTVSIMWFGLSK